MRRLRSLLKSIWQRRRVEQDMAAEMEFHLTSRTETLIRRGLSAQEATRQARLEFGTVEHYKEEVRQSRGLRWFDSLQGDIRYAWRQLRKTPTFSMLAVVILAAGIGGNTAIFSAIDTVMLQMLPVQKPEELWRVQWISRRHGFHQNYNGDSFENASGEMVAWSVAYPVYEYLRNHVSSFSGLSAFDDSGVQLNVTVRGHAALARGQLVSGDYFTTLGANALLGRTLLPEDDQPDAPAVAVLSYGYWEQMFGGDTNILGQTIPVNGSRVVIVGVLSKGQCAIRSCPDITLPLKLFSLATTQPDVLKNPNHWDFELLGRLRPEIPAEQARAELELALQQAIHGYHPQNDYDPPRVVLIPGGRGFQKLRGDEIAMQLKILASTMGIVLLIACANIAGLLVARAASRQREIGTRLAIGASQGRLIRQLLTESVLLSTFGGAAGIVLAFFLKDATMGLFVNGQLPPGIAPTLNLKVLLFSLGLCIVTGLVFGLAPAMGALRVDMLTMLKMSGATQDRSQFRTGKMLIAIQVALSLVLVTGSALFVQTLIRLRSETLGFQPQNLLMFSLNPTLNGYRDQRLLNFYEEVLKRIEQVPGVQSASFSRHGLLSNSSSGSAVTLPDKEHLHVLIHYVPPRYPETLGIPLLAGRDIRWTDRETTQPVAMINQTLARKVFSEQNPLGRAVVFNNQPLEVIGIVGDARYANLRQPVQPTIYLPFRQSPQHRMTYMVRSAVEPKAMRAAVKRVVESVDPNVPLYDVRTQVQQIDRLTQRERTFALLLSGFAILALVLSCLGIYGTLAYLVARRTPEIGIRLALGATRSDVVALVLRESMMPVIFGIAAGVAVSLAAGKMIESFLFGLKPRDPVSLIIAATVLIVCAILAGWWPARRASRIAPMDALRVE